MPIGHPATRRSRDAWILPATWCRSCNAKVPPFDPLSVINRNDTLDLSAFLSEHVTSIWAGLSSIVSGIGAWLLSRRNINAAVERARIETDIEISAVETAERTAFRALLMTEVATMRQLIRECEADKETLRERLNVVMAQSLILRATVEMMERRVKFYKESRGGDSSEVVEAEVGDTREA